MTTDSNNESSGVSEALATSQQSTSIESSSGPSEAAKLNFRELERQKKDAERRARELEARLIELEKAKQQPEDDEFEKLADDDIVEAKQLKKLKREIAELKTKNTQLSPEDISRIKYRDYDSVVTEDAVNEHLVNNPALAQMVKNAPNPYEAAYFLLKKMAPKQTLTPVEEKLSEVKTLPRSLNEAASKISGVKGQESIRDIEARRQEALNRAKKYLGGFY